VSRFLPAGAGALLVAVLSTGHAAGAEPWSADGTSTYEGTWTLTAWETDTDVLAPPIAVGEALPGTLRISCWGSLTATCTFEATREGETWVGGAAVDPLDEGVLQGTTEQPLNNCGGQLQRTIYDAVIGPDDADASVTQTTEPRTCEEGASTLYTVDSTWTFSGTLVDYVPPDEPPAAQANPYDAR
jgi:hypothetical protein